MRLSPLAIAYKLPTVLHGATLVAVTSICDVSARLVATSDIRKQVFESESISKVNGDNGDECIKLNADVVNREDVENIDLGILGCGEALTCFEDDSSSTGARCVDFEEVSVYGKASCHDEYEFCQFDSQCCSTLRCGYHGLSRKTCG